MRATVFLLIIIILFSCEKQDNPITLDKLIDKDWVVYSDQTPFIINERIFFDSTSYLEKMNTEAFQMAEFKLKKDSILFEKDIHHRKGYLIQKLTEDSLILFTLDDNSKKVLYDRKLEYNKSLKLDSLKISTEGSKEIDILYKSEGDLHVVYKNKTYKKSLNSNDKQKIDSLMHYSCIDRTDENRFYGFHDAFKLEATIFYNGKSKKIQGTVNDFPFRINEITNYVIEEAIMTIENEGIDISKIPQGDFMYKIIYMEHGGRMKGDVMLNVHGNCVTVSQKEAALFKGIIIKHKSGKWIIGEKLEDKNAEEIGGCTEFPIIDFEKKIIEGC